MHSDVSINRVKQFPPMMWILLFGAFISRGSYYMVWPFLSVILYRKFGISATEVGLILTSAAMISVIAGFLGSTLSDHLGRKPVMLGAGILYIISFSLLANVDSIWGYAVVITLCSIATEIWRPASSALVGDVIADKKTRELAMQALYFMVNVGCAIGPFLGFWLGIAGENETFYVTAIAFAVFLSVLMWGFKTLESNTTKYQESKQEEIAELAESLEQKENQFLQTLKVLAQDRLLQCLILANIICMFIYGQMDSPLIQYLTRADVPHLFGLISSLILTNTLVIISCQFLMLKLMARTHLVNRIQIGLALLTVSQLWMAFNPVDYFWGWVGAVAIMSLAEAILFPTMNVHIDQLAPDHLRGAYFGATAFYSLGFALAPLGGGLMLDYLGGFWLFMICTLLSLVVIYLYSRLDKMRRPDFTVANATAKNDLT